MVVLILATLFRLWGAFDNPNLIEDEPLHVPSAISLGTYGTTTSMSWYHPPLSGLMLYGSIRVLGNNPYGWRTNNVVFGTASVLLVYLIALCLYPGTWTPLLAGSLLAFDPFHIYFSRTTFQEIPATCFFLLYTWLMLEYSEKGRRTLPLAGIALGLTVATKAYFILAIPLVAGYAFYRACRQGEHLKTVLVDFIAALILLPGAVALFSYFKWFGLGHTLPEFFRMKMDAFRTLQSSRIEEMGNRIFVEAGGKPWEWFIKPIIFGFSEVVNQEKGRFVLEINNFPFRLLVLPSLLIATVTFLKRQVAKELLPPLLFLTCYALFLFVKRPMFSYSALVLLPFAWLAVARGIQLMGEWSSREVLTRSLFLFGVVAWGFYTFPLISARLVPLALYRPILSLTTIIGRL